MICGNRPVVLCRLMERLFDFDQLREQLSEWFRVCLMRCAVTGALCPVERRGLLRLVP